MSSAVPMTSPASSFMASSISASLPVHPTPERDQSDAHH